LSCWQRLDHARRLKEAMTFVPKRTIAPKLYANLSLLATGAALRFFLGNLHGA
jgi:hypothetical protein